MLYVNRSSAIKKRATHFYNPPVRACSSRQPKGHRNMKAAPPTDIDEYIARYPRSVQEKLQKIRSIIKQAAPDAEEAIKYQIPTFVLQGNLVHFAAFENHIGFYPTPSAIAAFSSELANYQSAKGSIQFPLNKPLPFALIKKMVEFRVRETREKIAAKKRKR